MSFRLNSLPEAWQNVLLPLRDAAEADLRAGESILAWLEPDLDVRLRFARGLVVLTDQRVLSFEMEAEEGARGRGTAAVRSRQWPLEPQSILRTRDEGAAGTLELLNESGRVVYWRFTPSRASAAHRLVDRLKAFREGVAIADEGEGGSAESLCRGCGLPVPPDVPLCVACAAAAATRPAQSLFRLAPFARARAGMLLLGFLLSVASTASSLISIYLIQPIYDTILTPYEEGKADNFHLIGWYLLGMAVAAILAWLLGWARTYVLAWVSERVAADLRNATYAHLQQLSLEFFGGKRTGDLISRVSTDTERINIFLSVDLLDFANDILMIVMTAAVMIGIKPWLAVVTLCPLPLIAWMVERVRTRLARRVPGGEPRLGRDDQRLGRHDPRHPRGKGVRPGAAGNRRFHRSNDHVLYANDRINRTWAFFRPTIVVLTDAGTLVVWVFGVWQIYHHQISVGILTMFLTYIGRFYTRLESMSRIVSAVQRAAAASQRVFGILDRHATVPEPAVPVHPGRLQGQIEFRDVGFRYGNRTVVEGVNLIIRPGEMVGLVGASGSGKTTLVNLVCRFYDVAEGAVLVDGTDIRSFSIEEYRRHIGLVLQEPFLFYGTIAENIAYGRPDAKSEEIIAAARAARATNSSSACPTATIRWSASGGNSSPAANGSESASPGRC